MDAHVIIAGQSNANVFGNTGPAPYAPTYRVQIWTDTNGDGTGDAWNYLNPGVNTGSPGAPTTWGPEVQLATDWLSDNADGYLWIVKVARGSTSLAADANATDWSQNSRGELFDFTALEADHARGNLGGGPFAFAAWDVAAWMHGETDATVAAHASSYQANLSAFDTAIRSTWMHDSAGKIVVGRISDSPLLPFNSDVRVAQWAEDQADPHMVSFKTLDFAMQADRIHLAPDGVIALGDAFYHGWLS